VRVAESPFFEDQDERVTVKPNGRCGDELCFRFTQFQDIALETAPPYVIDQMLPRLGVVVVWGPPKCGKTFWTFDVEMHVALGWNYRERRVEQGPVLHIACEGVAGLGARKEAWRIRNLANDEGATPPFYLCKNTALDLIADVQKVSDDIVMQFFGRDIRLITIDTLNRSLNGSESKDEDMAKYLRAAVAMAAQFQCLVLIVHHCGYDETHPRGHTSLRGGADGDIAVTKDAAGRVCTEVKNLRDGPEGAKTRSRLDIVEVGTDDHGQIITSCTIKRDDADLEHTAPPTKSKGPSPMARKFYEAFSNVGAQLSEPRYEAGNRPSITEEQWIAELEHRRLLDPIPADADKERRKAQNRQVALVSKYRGELIAANWIACAGKIIWSAKGHSNP
jgi:hypothetical protein